MISELKEVRAAFEFTILSLIKMNKQDILDQQIANVTTKKIDEALTKLDSYIERLNSEKLVEEVAESINDKDPRKVNTWAELKELANLNPYLFARGCVRHTRIQAQAAITTIKGDM